MARDHIGTFQSVLSRRTERRDGSGPVTECDFRSRKPDIRIDMIRLFANNDLQPLYRGAVLTVTVRRYTRQIPREHAMRERNDLIVETHRFAGMPIIELNGRERVECVGVRRIAS